MHTRNIRRGNKTRAMAFAMSLGDVKSAINQLHYCEREGSSQFETFWAPSAKDLPFDQGSPIGPRRKLSALTNEASVVCFAGAPGSDAGVEQRHQPESRGSDRGLSPAEGRVLAGCSRSFGQDDGRSIEYARNYAARGNSGGVSVVKVAVF